MAGRERGRPAEKMWVGFEILYRLNYLGFYFVYYHSNVTTVLGLFPVGFCKVKLKCVLSMKNLVAILFMSIPTIRY